MEINKTYSLTQIQSNGLVEKDVKDLNTRIFLNGDKVYFFEAIENEVFRLYTVINKRSFFL